jgi:hypothetical protein
MPAYRRNNRGRVGRSWLPTAPGALCESAAADGSGEPCPDGRTSLARRGSRLRGTDHASREAGTEQEHPRSSLPR